MESNNQLRSPFRPEGFDFSGQAALQGAQCLDCSEKFFPPRSACLKCSGTRLEPVFLNPTGKIYSFTVIHRAPTAFPAPYGAGWVMLDDGIKLWGMFKGAIEKFRVGLPVKIIFDKLGDRTIYYFTPVIE